jgi:hypothetical protein
MRFSDLIPGYEFLFAYASCELAPWLPCARTIRRDHGELAQGTSIGGASAGATLLPRPAGLRKLKAAFIALPAAPTIMILGVLAVILWTSLRPGLATHLLAAYRGHRL